MNNIGPCRYLIEGARKGKGGGWILVEVGVGSMVIARNTDRDEDGGGK